ncbi:MAG TPA: BON domain-containing protein [Gammaproteobacteria bacterium]|nr:BON domain-containing protein [Gammaproteobacteria bacterium]
MKISKTPSLRTLFMMAGMGAALAAGMPALASDDPAPTAHSDSVGDAISDTAVTAKVKAKFVGVDSLKGSDISVTTTNGMVTLTGTAGSSSAKSEAERLAKQVKGVKDVDNELKTPSSSKTSAELKGAANSTKQGVSDTWITTKAKSAITADSVAKGFDVHVETTNGVVVLSGQLANKDAIAHVKDIVEKIDGVKSVDTSGLEVAPGK